MATSSIMGCCAVRVARLEADGSIDFNNPRGTFTLCGGISKLAYDFEVEKGADIFEVDACGLPVVVRKRPDIVKRVTFTLTLARQDYRFDEIVGVSTNLVDVGAVVKGRAIQAAQGCGQVVTQGNGVSVELWSEQWDCDEPLTTYPYMRSIMPRAYFTPKGHDRSNGVALPVYEGYGVVNNLWHHGPAADVPELDGVTNWPWADVDDSTLPTCPTPNDYTRTNADVS